MKGVIPLSSLHFNWRQPSSVPNQKPISFKSIVKVQFVKVSFFQVLLKGCIPLILSSLHFNCPAKLLHVYFSSVLFKHVFFKSVFFKGVFSKVYFSNVCFQFLIERIPFKSSLHFQPSFQPSQLAFNFINAMLDVCTIWKSLIQG